MSDANTDQLAAAIAALVAAVQAPAAAPSAPQTMFTVDEAAERLRCSRSLIYSLIRDGRLRGIKLGRRRLIPAGEVDRIMRGDAA